MCINLVNEHGLFLVKLTVLAAELLPECKKTREVPGFFKKVLSLGVG